MPYFFDIPLSDKSKTLIDQANRNGLLQSYEALAELPINGDSINAHILRTLFQKEVVEEKTRFLLESLNGALLHDLNKQLLGNHPDIQEPEPAATWYRKAQFFLLVSGGTLIAICDGFNGIASILVLFPPVSSPVLIGAGCVFSALSAAVFFGFDLVVISNNFGVSFNESSDLLNVLVEQTLQIKQIRKNIARNYNCADINALEMMQTSLEIITCRLNALEPSAEAFAVLLNRPWLKAAKLTVALMTGVLFFSGGFFTGQSMALGMAAMISIPVTATSAPVILISVLTGLAAFSLYWNLERPGLENFVGQWVGLDKEKVDMVTNHNEIEKERSKISNVKAFVKTQVKTYIEASLESKQESPNQAGFFAHRRARSAGALFQNEGRKLEPVGQPAVFF